MSLQFRHYWLPNTTILERRYGVSAYVAVNVSAGVSAKQPTLTIMWGRQLFFVFWSRKKKENE